MRANLQFSKTKKEDSTTQEPINEDNFINIDKKYKEINLWFYKYLHWFKIIALYTGGFVFIGMILCFLGWLGYLLIDGIREDTDQIKTLFIALLFNVISVFATWFFNREKRE